MLVVSFVALSTLWRTPTAQQKPHTRTAVRSAAALEWLANLAGWRCSRSFSTAASRELQCSERELLGHVHLRRLLGRPAGRERAVRRRVPAFSPWRTCARAPVGARARSRAGAGRPAVLRYPHWLGMWPAVAGIVGFAWLELVYELATGIGPSTLAALSLGYFVGDGRRDARCSVSRSGAGRRTASRRTSTCSPALGARPRPRRRRLSAGGRSSGVTGLEVQPGTVALICTLIGTTTFDGFSNGGIWRATSRDLQKPVREPRLRTRTRRSSWPTRSDSSSASLLVAAIYRARNPRCPQRQRPATAARG